MDSYSERLPRRGEVALNIWVITPKSLNAAAKHNEI
jgi:hypothetical protein